MANKYYDDVDTGGRNDRERKLEGTGGEMGVQREGGQGDEGGQRKRRVQFGL